MSDNKTEQKPVIRIEDLHKYFGDNQVLRGINLEVMPGEKVVVLGPSGSGKSTMLRCINALEETTSGKIYVNDVDITSPKTDINKVREHLGMVFQRFNLWPHKTVLENLPWHRNSSPASTKPRPRRRPWKCQARRFGRKSQRLSRKPFRRSAAACCDCSRFGNGAEGSAV